MASTKSPFSVEADGRYDGALRGGQHIGGVHPAAQTDLKDQPIRRGFGEQQESRRRGDLEKGDFVLAIGMLKRPASSDNTPARTE